MTIDLSGVVQGQVDAYMLLVVELHRKNVIDAHDLADLIEAYAATRAPDAAKFLELFVSACRSAPQETAAAAGPG